MKRKKLHEHYITKGTSPDRGPSLTQLIYQKLAITTYNITFNFHRLLSWLPLLSTSVRSLLTMRWVFFSHYVNCLKVLFICHCMSRCIFHVCTLLLFLSFLLKWEWHCIYKKFHDNIHELSSFFFIFHYTLQNALLKLHISRISLNFLNMDYHW